MRWDVVLLLGAAYIFYQVLAKVPPKEELCGMIVDLTVEEQCLRCFTQAGHISKHPEKVRNCTATYLPPDLAECSVPHANKPVRIHQGGGEYHHNHTNANFLPSCLRRRLRNLKAYLKKEERFVKQASSGVDYIVKSTLIKHGGPTMLSIVAMASIMQLPGIKGLAEESASNCQDKYERGLQHLEKDLWEETDEYEIVLGNFMEEEEEEMKSELDMTDEMKEDSVLKKKPAKTPVGNHLPFGGTNSLAGRVMLYKCITSSLFENGAGPQLLETVMKDDFYSPIPDWLVKPLLKLAKTVAEQNL